MPPSVLFVSKPIAPPYHDGSKCLVRDVAQNLTRVAPIVLSTPGAPRLTAAAGALAVRSIAAYGAPGGFTPAFSANLRAAAWVLLASRASCWHFVFAPNARTSGAGKWLRRLRRVPVVQTIASPPRSFADPQTLFFGDVLVAQSAWTRRAIESSYHGSGLRVPRIEVIPPPAPDVTVPSAAEVAAVRRDLQLAPEQRYVLYPGDLETSSGAEATAALAERIPNALPDLVTVFAYRRKSTRASGIAARLAARLPPAHTRFLENAPNILALLAGAAAVIFPVDDLWGKVDLPIVLLEAMALGVPVIVLDQGPLQDLSGVQKVPTLDAASWLTELQRLLDNPERRAALVKSQRSAVAERHAAQLVARAYEDLYLELSR
ncbi:MAG TPA: glycosyltransferase family 4 protein [Polyangiaceae bacterium]|nr:glycosyltransferase family 4 protein [Polyangiaceae bacterium]